MYKTRVVISRVRLIIVTGHGKKTFNTYIHIGITLNQLQTIERRNSIEFYTRKRGKYSFGWKQLWAG